MTLASAFVDSLRRRHAKCVRMISAHWAPRAPFCDNHGTRLEKDVIFFESTAWSRQMTARFRRLYRFVPAFAVALAACGPTANTPPDGGSNVTVEPGVVI